MTKTKSGPYHWLRNQFKNAQRVFWVVVGISTLLKLWLAAAIPLTGDEGYYVMWGKYPAWGYYDQPPVIAWMQALNHALYHWFSAIGWTGLSSFLHSPLGYRLPAVFLSPLVAALIIKFVRLHASANQAYFAACLFLISPLPFFGNLITNDIPLIGFSVLAAYWFLKAISASKHVMLQATVAGIFLGLAFLSKYLAAFLVLALGVYTVLARSSKVWKCFLLVLLSSGIVILPHLIWNFHHSWATLAFNVVNRNRTEHFDPQKAWMFFLIQVYLLLPFLGLLNCRLGALLGQKATQGNQLFLLICFGVPVLALGSLSFFVSEGLHWVLAFYPFLYAYCGQLFSAEALKKAIFGSIAGLAIHLVVVGFLLSRPSSHWQGRPFFGGYAMYRNAPQLAKILQDYGDQYELATDAYSDEGLLEAYSPSRIRLFGAVAYLGRQDALMTQFRELAGKDFVIFSRKNKSARDFAPFFQTVEQKDVWLEGWRFSYFIARKFNYQQYLKVYPEFF